eukprot:g28364.t1
MAAGEAVVVGVRVRPFNDRENNLNAVVCIDMEGGVQVGESADFGGIGNELMLECRYKFARNSLPRP